MTYNVLFLCTGNSARSILAEAILNRAAPDKFKAYSAGSQPKGAVHPQALALLARLGYETSSYRSKSWDEFTQGPHFDFIFTVCDNRRQRSLSRLARPSHDRALGHSRSQPRLPATRSK